MRQLLALKWRLVPLVVAAVILCIPLVQAGLNHRNISQAAQAAEVRLVKTKVAKEPAKISGIPNRIIVPDLSIDLPVQPQTYSKSTKSWPVSTAVANYADSTAPLNNSAGESLIYGHNTRGVFGPLLNLKPGALVYVYTDNGRLFKYEYQSSQDITPTKLTIFEEMAKAPAGLKLITCKGPLFEYRYLMSFKLLQAS